nr:MAG TPA: hypothetical protein [Caudoviricetes sp.]
MNKRYKAKVVHLHLKEPRNGQSDFYFGSVLAMYSVLTREDVGAHYRTITQVLLHSGVYENKKCIVRLGELIRKRQTKGRIMQ